MSSALEKAGHIAHVEQEKFDLIQIISFKFYPFIQMGFTWLEILRENVDYFRSVFSLGCTCTSGMLSYVFHYPTTLQSYLQKDIWKVSSFLTI